MTYEVTIPEIGESITEALILRWIRNPGDHVGRDEPLVELETDKVTVEMPSPVAGVVSEIVAAEGETVPVGAVIARIEEGAARSAGSVAAAGAAASATSAAAATFGARTDVLAGADVLSADTAGREVVSPATTPAAVPPAAVPPAAVPPAAVPPAAVPPAERRRVMPAAQRLIAEHHLDPGAIPATGRGGRLLKSDVIAHLAARRAAESAPSEPPHPARPLGTAGPLAAAERPEPTRGGAVEQVAPTPASEAAAPAAAPTAAAPPQLPPAPHAGPSPAPSPANAATADGRAEERVAMTPIRRRIAERLVASQQQAALLTTFNEIDMSAVKDFRTRYRDAFEKRHDVRLGFLSFFVKAAVDALRRFPRLNAEISGTDILYRNYHDIGIAVSTDRGLMVPVLRNAERMSFAEIETRIADFAGRARTGRIRIDELQGGTFTITNGGVFGSLLSTPIINPPQSGVLGLHAIQDRPMVEDGDVVVRPMMYVALTYDHRIVDGREAVSFLVRIKEAIQDPARMLIEV